MSANHDQRQVLAQARPRCERLLGQLARDARELDAPNRLVPEAERVEGRAAYARAAAAAEALLRRLGESGDDAPHTPHPQ